MTEDKEQAKQEQATTPKAGTEQNSETEKFRKMLRERGETEEYINLSIAQMQILGELKISDNFEPDATIGSEEVNKIYIAVLSGRPDPIGNEESAALYAKIQKEVCEKPNIEWIIPID